MSLPLPQMNVLGVFKALKDDIETNVLAPRGLTMKSSGTKYAALSEPVDAVTGFWQNPTAISSKPPRWIVQVEVDATGKATARFATDPGGTEYGIAHTVGFANNGKGTGAVFAYRVVVAVRPHGQATWDFPVGWECLLLLGFASPLHAGTAADPMQNFDPAAGTVAFGTGAAQATYPAAFRAVVKAPGGAAHGSVTYDDAVAAVAALAGAKLCDGNSATDHVQIVADLTAMFGVAPPATPFHLPPDTALVGIDPLVYRQIEATVNSKKRHLILYGPPGTGKTTLAEYMSRELSNHDGGDGSYVMLTASSAWSAQDLVGGYQPVGAGNIKFIKGALLRDFDRPLIIDELNRCPIDRVLGPLFSVLSGQTSTLPYRTDISNDKSDFHVVLPMARAGMKAHEHAPGPAWRLVCTLNTYDKTQLGQISYALSRRFAWIKVGAPKDLEDFVIQLAARHALGAPATTGGENPAARMWAAVNKVREIGGAPIIDFMKMVKQLDAATDLFVAPTGAAVEVFLAALQMCVLPLMDGLSPREAEAVAAEITTAWSLASAPAEQMRKDFLEFSA